MSGVSKFAFYVPQLWIGVAVCVKGNVVRERGIEVCVFVPQLWIGVAVCVKGNVVRERGVAVCVLRSAVMARYRSLCER